MVIKLFKKTLVITFPSSKRVKKLFVIKSPSSECVKKWGRFF